MKSRDGKLISYYSNYGLEQSRLLRRTDMRVHDARIRAMMLLSDAVKIPLSHALRMPRYQLERLLDSNAELIANGLFRVELTDEYADPWTYADAFQRRAYGGSSDAMSALGRFESRGLQVSVVHASRHQQVSAYRQLVMAAIETGHLENRCSDIEAGRLLDIIASTPTKEEFDTLARHCVGDPSTRRSIVGLSNVVYFTVGSLSEGNVATSNAFLTSSKALSIQSLAHSLWRKGGEGHVARRLATPRMPSTSELYDPDAFLLFLKTVGAIRHECDVALLSYDDLRTIRNDSGFRKFTESYKKLARQSVTLADLYARYDVELRWRYMGLTAVTLIMLGAYQCAMQGDEIALEDGVRAILDSAWHAVEFAGVHELLKGTTRRLQFATQANHIAKTVDGILREAEASIVPLSYAADLIGAIARRHG